jgi:hypothetical protein
MSGNRLYSSRNPFEKTDKYLISNALRPEILKKHNPQPTATMNDLITNRLNTIKACINVANSDQNRPVWENQPPLAFAADLAALSTGHQSAVDLATRAATAALGHSDAKDAAEDVLENTCYKISRALASHFKKTGDLTNLAKVDYKLGHYQKLRDTHLIAAARDLITIAGTATAQPGAVERGVTAGLIAQLQTACDTFAGTDAAPRSGIVLRSTLLRDLSAAVADLMEKLADLDDLVIQYDASEAGRTFISAWKQARAIIDSGHGPSEAPAPPPTPSS